MSTSSRPAGAAGHRPLSGQRRLALAVWSLVLALAAGGAVDHALTHHATAVTGATHASTATGTR